MISRFKRYLVLVVSHDREFLNNVVTSTIAFENDGPREFVGGYDDWVRQRIVEEEKLIKNATLATPAKSHSNVKKKLSYKEQRELEALPKAIEKLESQVTELHTSMAKSDFYKQPANLIAAKQAELKTLEDQIAHSYLRWEELEKAD